MDLAIQLSIAALGVPVAIVARWTSRRAYRFQEVGLHGLAAGAFGRAALLWGAASVLFAISTVYGLATP